MLSHQDRCVFVHIPKTAGQSIESFFLQRNNIDWKDRQALLLKPNQNPELGPPRLAHLTATEYTRCDHMSADEFTQYFKFSFVRNPWHRLVSEFLYRRKLGHDQYQKTFKHFLFNEFPSPDCDDYAKSRDNYRHIIPQYRFLFDDTGHCLVDFIGRFENLQHDFERVCSQLNIDSATLPHANKTNSQQPFFKKIRHMVKQIRTLQPNYQNYAGYYDQESRDFVAQYYEKDIKLFDYRFEGH